MFAGFSFCEKASVFSEKSALLYYYYYYYVYWKVRYIRAHKTRRDVFASRCKENVKVRGNLRRLEVRAPLISNGETTSFSQKTEERERQSTRMIHFYIPRGGFEFPNFPEFLEFLTRN